MKNIIFSAIFALVVTVASTPSFANGADQKVAVDKYGRALKSIVSGECVLTKWDSESDVCAAPKTAQPAPTPPKKIVSTLKRKTPKTYTVSDKRSYIVFFDYNKSGLSSSAEDVLNNLYSAIRGTNKAEVELTGHADRSGSDSYNMALSKKRAMSVKDRLVTLGVPSNNISVNWKGESEPLVKTNDGIKEPQNRRTEIKVFTESLQTR